MKLPSVSEERQGRNVKFFRGRHEQGRPKLDDAKRRHILLKELVESRYYQALVNEALSMIEERTPAIPSSVATLISWNLDNMIRDVLVKFFDRVEEKAKHAVDPADYEVE